MERGEMVITRILHGSSIDRQGMLHVGDVIREVNGRTVGSNPHDFQELLRDCSGTITLKVLPSYKDAPAPPQVRGSLERPWEGGGGMRYFSCPTCVISECQAFENWDQMRSINNIPHTIWDMHPSVDCSIPHSPPYSNMLAPAADTELHVCQTLTFGPERFRCSHSSAGSFACHTFLVVVELTLNQTHTNSATL